VANEHVRGKSTGPERYGANLFQTTFLKNRKDLAGTLAPTAGRHGHGGRQKEQGMRQQSSVDNVCRVSIGMCKRASEFERSGMAVVPNLNSLKLKYAFFGHSWDEGWAR
jgi:hypothetical protein